ncbi:DHA2 family efflux MFS transporter permease subunit [Streptomyces sp. NPDC005805]|uniref:DHA2 family efflux MFS transporter permease subunit n=1 Tax=Streptomyces sp. NPDC005805 TaxID=3157068 RepID=UPI0033C71E25
MSADSSTSDFTGIDRGGPGEVDQERKSGAAAAASAAAQNLDPRRWKALAVLCTAFFMMQLDAQIVLLALPSIQADLALTASGAQWVMSAYLLTFGGLLLLGGRSADLLGRRRMFVIGMALFLFSSLLAGLAWNGEIMILGRVGQGISAAIVAPTALSILISTFTDGKELNKALAIWAANGAGGAMAALLVGGPINDTLGWEWIFFINIPVAIVVIALAPRLLKESKGATGTRSFDTLGAVTITVALVAFIYGVVEAPAVGWTDARTVGLLVGAAVLIALFVVIEKRAKAPLVPLELFRSRNLVGGNVVMLLIGMVTFGAVLVISLYAQQVLGYTALVFGLSTVVYTVMSVTGSQIGSRIITKYGFRKLGVVSTVLMGVGVLLLTQVSVDGSYFADLFWGLLIFGFGLGLGFVAVSIAALTGIPEESSGIASGINTAAFQMGGALGTAVASAVTISYTTGGEKLEALTNGFQAGFVALAILAAASVVVTLLLFKPPKEEAGSGAEQNAVPHSGL